MTRTYRTLFLVFAATIGLGWSSLSAARADDDDKGFVSLFNGKNLDGLKTILQNGKADDGKVFSVKEGVIVVLGNPNGYFYTDKSYKNYVLKFDWKFIKDGNSGCLVHITGKHQVWPKCVEVQGLQKDHGTIFAIGGAKGTFKKDAKAQKEAIKIGEWNTTEITCQDGAITSKINGKQIATGKGDQSEGQIGWQSEGTELHFKNIKIKVQEDDKGKDGQTGVRARAVEALTSFADDDDDKGFVKLFNGKNFKGWKFFLADKDADPVKSFMVKDGVIEVPGFPNGYFYTEESYKNYVVRYDWTYPKDQPEKTTMNSGLLVHMQTPHKVWPKSVEPQGRYKDHGKLFFIGFDKGAKTEQMFDEKAQQKALKPHYEWNTTEATCKSDGSISVKINGQLINTGKSELTEGPIGFQSEGARIHFRNILIKKLD